MISIENLSKTYQIGKRHSYPALSDVSLQIEDGELLAITGPSGAGKSTLLHILACVDSFDSGSVKLDGQELSRQSPKKLAQLRGTTVSIVLQDFGLLEDFTVLDNVMLPLYFSKGAKKEKKARAMELLQQMGLAEMAKKNAGQLCNISGKQPLISLLYKLRIKSAELTWDNYDASAHTRGPVPPF